MPPWTGNGENSKKKKKRTKKGTVERKTLDNFQKSA